MMTRVKLIRRELDIERYSPFHEHRVLEGKPELEAYWPNWSLDQRRRLYPLQAAEPVPD